MPAFLFTTVRILQLFTLPSSPEVARIGFPEGSSGEKTIDVTRAGPCGLSIRVLRVHSPIEFSLRHTFRCTSPWKDSSPSRESIVASHSPEEETTARSTREGSSIFSSLRETRLEGDTSNSESNFDEDGEYSCNEDGCEEGSMTVDDSECTVRGVGADVDGLLCDTAGSECRDDQSRSGGVPRRHSPSFMPEYEREIFNFAELMKTKLASAKCSR